MQKRTGLLNKIDEALLPLLLAGFTVLIPLYPKFPIRIIDYTYIAVRAEDIYIALFVIIYLIQLIRKKITIHRRFLIPVLAFWSAVFASFLINHYITGTLIYKHLGFLHAARRVEYMVIFLMASSIVRSRRQLGQFLALVTVVLVMVSLYGIGQKFIGWPAVQTMNPEFAKGHLLTLTPEARVSSTFAGHYDLAAYYVFLIPVILGLFFATNQPLYYAAAGLAIFLLTLTASRISAIIAYPLSTASYLLTNKRFKHFLFISLITAFCLLLSNNLISRVLKTVQIKQIFVNQQTGEVVVPQKITSKELPAGTSFIVISKPPVAADQNQTGQLLKEKLLEEIRKEASAAKRILTATEEAELLATREAGLTQQNTIVTDISFSTRLQVEWPRAFFAFVKNPLFGAGPSAITESTDNDYLRSIGEVGAIGTVLFGYLLFTIVQYIWKFTSLCPKKDQMLYLGYIFGLGGLLLNASYIDVFEASKVAYTFWMVSGFFVGAIWGETSLKKQES